MSEEWIVVSPVLSLLSGSFRGEQTIINKDEPRMDTNRHKLRSNYFNEKGAQMLLQSCFPGMNSFLS